MEIVALILCHSTSLSTTSFIIHLLKIIFILKYKLSHKSKKYGTEVGVTPLLFGGYTRICGMEGQLDELLPQALMSVQETGSLEVGALAAKLNCEDERAYNLLYTLADCLALERRRSGLRQVTKTNKMPIRKEKMLGNNTIVS